MRRTAALIVGGGPAGAAAAIMLARGGERPLIVERTLTTPDMLCGGFMSWHTLKTLERIGIDSEALGGAPIHRLRLFAGGRMGEAPLPAPAIGLSRRRLDSALVALARRQGAAIERGVGARRADGLLVTTDDGGEIAPQALFLATGKHDLRGLGRPHDEADPMLGLRIHLPAHQALARLTNEAIELHLFDRGYAGLQLQEDGRANLCLAVRKSRLTEAGGRPAALIAAIGAECPALGERLAFLDAGAVWQAVGAMPYGWRADTVRAGLFRLGDQAGVIASLAGEGVGIALASGMMAARAFLRDGAAASGTYQADFRRRLMRPVGIASLVHDLASRPAIAPWMARAVGIAPPLASIVARATRIRIPAH